jgi:hypothetical protein
MVEKMGYELNKRLIIDHHNKPEQVTIGGKTHKFRSQGEIKLAHYFELLKIGGHISDWFYETTNFIFPDDTYLVDFDIRNNDNTFEYYELKGYLTAKSKRNIRLLNKYRPEVKLTMVFLDKKNMKKMGLLANKIHRVCLLKELTHGIV